MPARITASGNAQRMRPRSSSMCKALARDAGWIGGEVTPTVHAASGPHAATLWRCSAPISKLSGRRAKTLELILLPSPAQASANGPHISARPSKEALNKGDRAFYWQSSADAGLAP